MKKVILLIAIIAVVGFIYSRSGSDDGDSMEMDPSKMMESSMPSESPSMMNGEPMMEGERMIEDGTMMEEGVMMGGVKEFALDSFMKMDGETRVAGFSVKEIVVKKGDKVKIAVTNTGGTHDFVIDEFKVKTDTPEAKTTIIEFTADKVGEFKYYCSKYNHRQLGQEGVLKVTE